MALETTSNILFVPNPSQEKLSPFCARSVFLRDIVKLRTVTIPTLARFYGVLERNHGITYNHRTPILNTPTTRIPELSKKLINATTFDGTLNRANALRTPS